MTASKMGFRVLISVALVLSAQNSKAYSVLAHEALIDSCWARSIVPLLLAKFPGSTKAQLKTAHAYAYGGAIAPDIGYFPFGNPFFTNLVHYVRSGDFVDALLADAQDINEYAFALGFLSHYMADKYGHSLATNLSVPLLYPEERKKFGNDVTYEEDHLSHKRTEFGFDVLQTVEGDYARVAYHDFIGFRISNRLLERAFAEVYGLDIHQVFFNFSLSVVSLRWSFKRLFPGLTGAAWILKKKQLKKAHPESTSKGKRPTPGLFGGVTSGIFARVYTGVFAICIEILPKVGPLRVMKIKAPGPAEAKLYYASFDTTVSRFNAALQACRAGTSRLANIDFDTGNFTTPGEYVMADENYDKLVIDLKKNDFRLLNGDLRTNINEFYGRRVAPIPGSRRARKSWMKTEAGLKEMQKVNDVAVD